MPEADLAPLVASSMNFMAGILIGFGVGLLIGYRGVAVDLAKILWTLFHIFGAPAGRAFTVRQFPTLLHLAWPFVAGVACIIVGAWYLLAFGTFSVFFSPM
jgi:hypothetical protein